MLRTIIFANTTTPDNFIDCVIQSMLCEIIIHKSLQPGTTILTHFVFLRLLVVVVKQLHFSSSLWCHMLLNILLSSLSHHFALNGIGSFIVGFL